MEPEPNLRFPPQGDKSKDAMEIDEANLNIGNLTDGFTMDNAVLKDSMEMEHDGVRKRAYGESDLEFKLDDTDGA